MQNFLPYSNIYDSAMVLDMRRLNKQILESDQMINAELTHNDKFYKNHPARKMWAKNIAAHKMYRDIMLKTWYKRGGKGNRKFYYNINNVEVKFPDWFYNPMKIANLSKSHRKALLIKDFEYYKDKPLFKDEIDDLVLNGKDLKGYEKLITRGKNKGKIKYVSATTHKQEYIRDNNIYYWVKGK